MFFIIKAFVNVRMATQITIRATVVIPTPRTKGCNEGGSTKFEVSPGGGCCAGTSWGLCGEAIAVMREIVEGR